MSTPLPPRERIKLPRQRMPEPEPIQRRCNFAEVTLGLSQELARQQALRCLECASPQCSQGCPVGVKLKEFVQSILEGDFSLLPQRSARTMCCRPSQDGSVRKSINVKAAAFWGGGVNPWALAIWNASYPMTSVLMAVRLHLRCRHPPAKRWPLWAVALQG